jgi:cobalt-precorrin-5B (C1)-methyltransferase
VPDGLERSRKTLNARLGVVGGLSILGTTGIVRPYSTAAYKASISKAIDVAIACGNQEHILLTTGSRSEKFARRYIFLPDEAYIQMGEFTGYALRDCARKGVRSVTLVGMIGKLSKIGDGRMQTHVAGAEVDVQGLAAVAEKAGASAEVVALARQANTARHFQELMLAHGLSRVFDLICERARATSQAYVHNALAVDVLMCDFDGSILGYAGERNVQ